MTLYNALYAEPQNTYAQIQGHDDVPLENLQYAPHTHMHHREPNSETLDRNRLRECSEEEARGRENPFQTVSSTYSLPISYTDSTQAHNLVKTPTAPRRHAAFTLGDWIWEFAAAVVSLGCLAAAIVVLAIYDDKSLTSWSFIFHANLNTVIAILSTLSRTALLVPVASCISQLKWIHLASSPRSLRDFQIFDDASRGPWGALELIWRLNFRSKLATWGSFITILTLAMGPFAQQLVSYPIRLQFAPQATFYSARIYDSGTSRGVVTSAMQLGNRMDFKLQGTIVNGLYNLSVPVQVSCPTGNCRWNQYTTFGVASNCNNVTQATLKTCDTSVPRTTRCNYTTPSGFNIRYSGYQSASGGYAPYYNSSARTQDTPGYNKSLDSSTMINFALARFMKNYSVTECSMRWVARTFNNTTVMNGTFNPGTWCDHELKKVENPYQNDPHSVQWDSFNVTNDSLTDFPRGLNSTFFVSPRDNTEIQEFLKKLFESAIDDPLGLALLNSTDLTKTLEMISTSMTYFMGRSPSGNEITGDSITTEQYIHVQWPWIIIPVLEVSMAISLLICILIHTSRKGVVAWKSSGIVPLFTVMQGWEEKQMSGAPWRELDRRSKEMKGMMVEDGSGVPHFTRVG